MKDVLLVIGWVIIGFLFITKIIAWHRGHISIRKLFGSTSMFVLLGAITFFSISASLAIIWLAIPFLGYLFYYTLNNEVTDKQEINKQ
jgi:Ca2+/Na+ antiporter